MRAAAQLGGEIPHADDTHFVAVFLAEQRHCAVLDRLVVFHAPYVHCVVGTDRLVHQNFHVLDFFRRHGLRVREIEARTLRIDQRAFLHDVITQHFAQRGMQQMRRGVVPYHALARYRIHMRFHRIAYRERADFQHAFVAEHFGLDFLRVINRERAIG